jgi:FkbM family methyltransferase
LALTTITPFRQLARLYGSFLSSAASLAAIQAASAHQVATTAAVGEGILEELKSNTARVDATIARVDAMAARLVVSDTTLALRRYDNSSIDLYGRLGLKLLLDRASLVDRDVIDGGTWEPAQTDFFVGLMKRFLSQDIVFLDLGSYWGLYSLLAHRAGVRTIHTFDADRHNFAQLQAQIFLNDATSTITPYNKAISDTTGTVTFWDSRNHPGGNRAGVGVVPADLGYTTIETPCVSIDEFFNFRDRTIFIKLDLEGHEDKALLGMRRTFAANRVVAQVEMFEDNPVRFKQIMKVIDELGLREINAIYPDRYYTNIPAAEFGV